MHPKNVFWRRAALIALSAHIAGLAAPAVAEPRGGLVTAGGALIDQSSPATTVIHQSTDRAIIHWQSFSTAAGETVRFQQPSAASATLNRVTGAERSVINGALEANGRVYLVNPNGVLFGTTARVQVGGLVASSLEMRDDHFLAGRDELGAVEGRPAGAVVNRGWIRTREGGSVALVGGLVDNQGSIQAPGGSVTLAAGRQVTLALDARGLATVARVAVPGDVHAAPDAVSDLARQAVNNRHLVPAGSVSVVGGTVVLGGAEGLAINQGAVDGGATATAAAGSVRVDSALATVAAAGSSLAASGAGYASAGGEVRLLSRGTTVLAGGSQVEARGGASGDGGFVEVSGDEHVHLLGSADVSAPGGVAGRFLIDPVDLRIVDGDGAGLASGDTIAEAALEAVASGTIVLEASNSITLEDIDGGGQDRLSLMKDVSLELRTGAGILVFSDPTNVIEATGTGVIRVIAGSGSQQVTRSSGASLTFAGAGTAASPGGAAPTVSGLAPGPDPIGTANPIQQLNNQSGPPGPQAAPRPAAQAQGATIERGRPPEQRPVPASQSAASAGRAAPRADAGGPGAGDRGGAGTGSSMARQRIDDETTAAKNAIDRKAGSDKQKIESAAGNDRGGEGRARTEQAKQQVDARAREAKRQVEERAIDDTVAAEKVRIDETASREKLSVDRQAAAAKEKIDAAAKADASPGARARADQAKKDVDDQANAAKKDVDDRASRARREVDERGEDARFELEGRREDGGRGRREPGRPALPGGPSREDVVAEDVSGMASETAESEMTDEQRARARRLAIVPSTQVQAPQLRPTYSAGLAGGVDRASIRSTGAGLSGGIRGSVRTQPR